MNQINISGNDLKRATLADGRLATVSNCAAVPEQTIVIPASITYPEQRMAYPSGSFPQGCTISVEVTVTDADGNDITPSDGNVFQMTLDQYPSDPTKEVLGVLYFNFTEGTLPDPIIADPGVIADPVQQIRG